MSGLARVLQYLVAAGFTAAAVVAYRDWLIWRGRGRAYLAAAVALLASVSILGLATAAAPPGLAARLAVDVEVAAFLGVGYCLFLYRHHLDPVPRLAINACLGLNLVAFSATVAVVTMPLTGVVPILLNGCLVLAAWVACVGEASVHLWRIGGSRPALQRARLRALALAYGGIVVVTAVESLSYAPSAAPATQVSLQGFSLLLVPVLFVAFAPPVWLRRLWRQHEEEAYGAAMRDLLVAPLDQGSLAAGALEWAVRLVGGAGGVVLGSGGEVAASLDVSAEQAGLLRAALTEGGDRVAISPIDDSRAAILLPGRGEGGAGGLAVVSGSFSPVFGTDELARLEQYVVATAAALERADMIASLRQHEDTVRALNQELEERVRVRTEELEASNRELEAFSYTVSHDLRAPLRAVDGFARILLDEYEAYLPDEGKRYLRLIGGNAEDMGRLIDGLLTFSRLSRAPMRRQSTSPTLLAEHAIGVVRAGLDGRTVDFRVDAMPDVLSDPVLLEEVFANLIGNAVKFTRDRDEARVEVGCEQHGGEAGPVFLVRDNGIGFDMRYAEKIFGVFQRLHRGHDYEGTGAGLAIVQRIIKRHGGKVWADSVPGQGATFYFTLGGPGKHD